MVNLEYRFPIYKEWGGELFIDGGRLYNGINGFNSSNFSWNYGAGITYDTTLGPVRVEYAIPFVGSNINYETIHENNQTKDGIFHVSLLYMF